MLPSSGNFPSTFLCLVTGKYSQNQIEFLHSILKKKEQLQWTPWHLKVEVAD